MNNGSDKTEELSFEDDDTESFHSVNNEHEHHHHATIIDEPVGDSLYTRKTSFISIHRRQRQNILEDANKQTRHMVPETASNIRQRTKKFATKTIHTMKDTASNRTPGEWAEMFVPALRWLKTYHWRTTILKDILAGLTVGVMIVPQSMAYAELAGLPVEYGLYSALVPVYAYAFFGSSRQLAVGPVALISLLLNTGITHILGDRTADTDLYAQLAIQIAFLAGVVNIGMGLLRLGFVTIFLSHAVVSGFTTGAAVIIGMSQVKYIFGYDVERSDVLHEILYNIFKDIDQFNYKTFLMGMSCILALVVLKHIGKTYPKYKWVRAIGPLTVTGVSILVTWAADLSEKGIPIVGTIPRGLPSYTANLWTPITEDLGKVMTTTLSIVIVGFMESIAIAKQLASKHKYELDSSQELMGLGMSNLMGAMFQSYPVTGSFSRSAVNNEAGAQSGISGIVTATLVGFVLLFLTPVFEQMPLATLAAIVISGVLGLLDYEEAIYLWKVHKFDFGVWMIACLGTMFLGVEIGLAIAVGVSLLLVIYESAYPHTAVLGRLPGTNVYRNVKQYPEAERYDGIVMVRIDAPIYFANTQNVREKLQKYEHAAEEELAAHNGTVHYMVLELSPVSHVDTSALHILHDMHKDYKNRGIQLCFCNPNVQVMERFRASGFLEEVGLEHFFVSIHDAVDYCLQQMDTAAVSLHEGSDNGSPRAAADVEAGLEDDFEDTQECAAMEDETEETKQHAV